MSVDQAYKKLQRVNRRRGKKVLDLTVKRNRLGKDLAKLMSSAKKVSPGIFVHPESLVRVFDAAINPPLMGFTLRPLWWEREPWLAKYGAFLP